MSSVTQLESDLKHLLEERANALALETGFIKRTRKLTGADFVQGLIFGWWQDPDASLELLTAAIAERGVEISAAALFQRFSEASARFLQRLLSEVVQLRLKAAAPPTELLSRFAAVVIEDSTQISLPDALAPLWRGRGGKPKHTEAAIKLHLRWDLLSGSLSGPLLSSGRLADQRSPHREQPAEAGTLYIADEGYFGLKWLAAHTASGGFFLTRPKSNTIFLDRRGYRLDLAEIGPQAVNSTLDLLVLVGKEVLLPTRLIMVRVSQEVAEQRRQKIREVAKQHGREVKERQLVLAQWTIVMTNVPLALLSVGEVLVLLRARWQIERLFRLWKEHMKIDEWRSQQPWRILTELYAKLIAVVIQQWCLLLFTWQDPNRSLVKAATVLRQSALRFIEALCGEMSFCRLLTKLGRKMARCHLQRRGQRPSLCQLLQDGLDWGLT